LLTPPGRPVRFRSPSLSPRSFLASFCPLRPPFLPGAVDVPADRTPPAAVSSSHYERRLFFLAVRSVSSFFFFFGRCEVSPPLTDRLFFCLSCATVQRPTTSIFVPGWPRRSCLFKVSGAPVTPSPMSRGTIFLLFVLLSPSRSSDPKRPPYWYHAGPFRRLPPTALARSFFFVFRCPAVFVRRHSVRQLSNPRRRAVTPTTVQIHRFPELHANDCTLRCRRCPRPAFRPWLSPANAALRKVDQCLRRT